MLALMQNKQLLLSHVLRHANRFHSDAEVVSCQRDGKVTIHTYGSIYRRTCQLAAGLKDLGAAKSDRIGTLAWNDFRHMEIYYAASGLGAICHTINPRLHFDDIAYIINDAEDKIIFFDYSFLELIERIKPMCLSVKNWICLNNEPIIGYIHYEAILADRPAEFSWEEFDENTASSLCYTSGTTGKPKGVLSSHRSTMLMVMAMVAPDVFNLSARDTVLAVAPMFHVAAWGFPFAAPMVGAKLVLPGPDLSGSALFHLMDFHSVTLSTGVPTVWIGVVEEILKKGRAPLKLRRASIGGSACTEKLIQTLEDLEIEVLHSWGMTELSPLGTMNQLKSSNQHLETQGVRRLKLKQGRPCFGIDLKIIDDKGQEISWDASAKGALFVQGYWALERYYKNTDTALDSDGWFNTGDIASIDSDGYLMLIDRDKDIIKSGGEWISSMELERIGGAFPGIKEIAVVGIPHLKWQERPIVVITIAPNAVVNEKEFLSFMADKVASWQIPDKVVIVDEIPKSGTGKVDKKKLRHQFKYALTTEAFQ